MKAFSIAALSMAASLATGASFAQVTFDIPANLPATKPALTRAEVVADLVVWRASGLDNFTSQEVSLVDTSSADYVQAEAKYAYLRASPQFASLVDQIQRGGSARVAISQPR